MKAFLSAAAGVETAALWVMNGPRAADTPPGNMVAGTAAAVADRVGDTVSGLAQGGVSALGDVIAMVLRRQKPRTAPTGSSQARKTAGRLT